MISRRNYITLTILMAVVLFLCMCLNSLKDGWNDYAVNRYTETAENYPSKVNIYVPGSAAEESAGGEEAPEKIGAERITARNCVVCIGDRDRLSLQAAEIWAAYTKRDLAVYSSLESYRDTAGSPGPPEMMVLDPESINWKDASEIRFLNTCVEEGTHLVFCDLPDAAVIGSSLQVQELLGIRSVLQEEVSVTGFHLREGFLLGGETSYLEKERPDAETYLPGSKAFPVERTFPWYLPGAGTKVYMKGIPEGDDVKADQYPIVMWRKSFGTAYVFAVNGEWMEGMEGLGILSAMSAEMYSYELYPVLNAQNIILAGYPSVADENALEMERIYSRSVKQVFQEILWPGISTLLQKYDYRATCMMTPQYDYSDRQEPDGKQLNYYLKIFNERGAETGLSGVRVSNTSIREKLEADRAFFGEALGGYDVVSFHGGDMGEEEIMEALQTDMLASVRTIVRDYDASKPEPAGFLSENVTVQSTLGDGMEYTYKSDFLVRSIKTALGYFSMSYDLSRVAYPEKEEEAWEQLSQALASTISTYGSQFPEFARTTAAECDMHIRQFLALDYCDSRTGDCIELQVEGVNGPVWFILRTHNEAVKEMKGGSWQKLEEGAYLIEVTESKAVLILKPADVRFYR